MAERLSRKALYDLVWSEPMKTLAARFGISDVGLKKTCARAQIPTPDRGYWAKKDAGKQTFQADLPIRPPGIDDEVLIGGGNAYSYQYRTDEEVLGPLSPPPEFSEPIETVRTRIADRLEKVTVPHKVVSWHPAIDRLLKEDERRREKQLVDPYPMSWNKPLFDGPFERRRLRILNSLFFAAGKMDGKSSIYGGEAREVTISFFDQHVYIALDKVEQSYRRGQGSTAAPESNDSKLSLSILDGPNSKSKLATWQDDGTEKIEMRMTEIAVQVVLTAEVHYRENIVRRYQWRVERKAQLEEEARKRKLEAERAEKERQRRIEQARVDRLLRDAAAFQQASAIRQYVEAIRSTLKSVSSDEFEEWSKWALAQADRIDPSIGGAFLKAMQDDDTTTK